MYQLMVFVHDDGGGGSGIGGSALFFNISTSFGLVSIRFNLNCDLDNINCINCC